MFSLLRLACLTLLLLSAGARAEEEKIERCQEAMLTDFEGLSQEDMMECADLLEGPLKQLEEETKAREAAEAEALRTAAEAEKKRKEQEAKKEADLRAARKKAQDEAAAEEFTKAKAVAMVQDNLASCQEQLNSAVALTDEGAQCASELKYFEANHVKVDPRIKPLFGSRSLEVVVGPALVLFCVLFWLLGCCVERGRVVPMANPIAGGSGVSISQVIIRPGNEVCILKNRTFGDVDLTGCSLRVADHVYHFDDGYNLAKATSVEIHAGPDAKEIKKIPVADHDKFDSRRCNKLFWTSASVFLGSGSTTATLLDANDHVICGSN